MTTPLLATDKLSAMYGKFTAVKNVSLTFAPNRVHALIGPSGCGKSTFLRTLNRMHENTPGAWIVGRVLLEGADVYAPEVSPMRLRRRVGTARRASPLLRRSDGVLEAFHQIGSDLGRPGVEGGLGRFAGVASTGVARTGSSGAGSGGASASVSSAES